MLGDFPRTVTASGMKAAKLDGVLRYWPKPGGSSVVVGLSKAECADLLGNDAPFSTIYESGSASWMSGGFAAGVAAGNWLKQQFAAAAFTPPCVYLAADSNTIPAVAVNACLDGAASVLGRAMVGLYGYLPQLQAAQAGAHASRYWLTGHYVTPGSYPWINVYQCQGSQPSQYPTTVSVSGQTGDGDIAFTADWGQTGVNVVTAPVWVASYPANTPEGDFLLNRAGVGAALSADKSTVTVTISPGGTPDLQGLWTANTFIRVAMLADQQLPQVIAALAALTTQVADLEATVAALTPTQLAQGPYYLSNTPAGS